MKFTRVTILLFFLSFSASAGILIETFDNGDLEDWHEIVQLNKASGSWEVVDGELHAVSRETFVRLLTTGDDTWENYTVEFDVKPLKKHGIGEISIAVRVSGTWLVYCTVHDPVVIIGDDPAVHETRMDCVAGDLHDIVFTPLDGAHHPLLKLNKWAHLKLDVSGNIFTFWVNEKQVMAPTEFQLPKVVQDRLGFPSFLTGGVGFGLANYTARFDNITVTGDGIPNKGGLAVRSKGKLAIMWGNLKRF